MKLGGGELNPGLAGNCSEVLLAHPEIYQCFEFERLFISVLHDLTNCQDYDGTVTKRKGTNEGNHHQAHLWLISLLCK